MHQNDLTYLLTGDMRFPRVCQCQCVFRKFHRFAGINYHVKYLCRYIIYINMVCVVVSSFVSTILPSIPTEVHEQLEPPSCTTHVRNHPYAPSTEAWPYSTYADQTPCA